MPRSEQDGVGILISGPLRSSVNWQMVSTDLSPKVLGSCQNLSDEMPCVFAQGPAVFFVLAHISFPCLIAAWKYCTLLPFTPTPQLLISFQAFAQSPVS